MTWAGKILRVNLTAGTCTSEPLNQDWANDYLGGRGLGTKYFVEEVDATVDPLGEDNKLLWCTGPLTGTVASTGGRYCVVTKGPLTGAIACSNSGGYFGAELKMAGRDMIIVEGKSDKPVYLSIVDDEAELRDASHIWGKTVWDTEEIIKREAQDPQVRVSSIGRAGENCVKYAAVVNDLHRAAGRSGVGAVAGSKNLKAISVRGTLGVGNIHDPAEFIRITAEKKRLLAEDPGVQGMTAYGTQMLMNVINESGALPTRNYHDSQFEGANNIGAEAMMKPRESDGKTQLVTNQACFGCTIACGRISKIDETHFSVVNKPEYWGASGGLEYEAAWALGAACGVDDVEALQYANLICNEDGMDPITFGGTVAALMDLVGIGAVSVEEVGTEAEFGSAKALCELADMVASGTGFGATLGLGSKRMCEKYGHPELSMSVKGQEFPAYDGRALQGMGLGYATSNRGACHLRGFTVSSEILGAPVKTDPQATEGKAELLKAFQDVSTVVDCTGVCNFITFAWTVADIAPQVQAACDPMWTEEYLMLLAERVWSMERDFNNRAGFTKADDTLPKRLFENPCSSGPLKGAVSKLGEMLPDYYAARGWDAEGQLTDETRERLGL